ncbi:MAG: A/G-specific adenine glycosylase [Alcaligenaceae bacterium]|nr:A/G-specific adenine glycosylase [Alcaligenaceae bacterium]
MNTLVNRVIEWQTVYGRHGLPWQNTTDPYHIWLSEIMLQQTQVVTVIDYYQRFLERFPDVYSLAQAEQDEVMSYWAGLGYYARARNLHQCAKRVVCDFGGYFPKNVEDMVSLPGIGRSTAHAILAFSDGQTLPIMDGNVKRVFARYFGVEGVVTKAAIDRQLWQLGFDCLDRCRMQDSHIDMVAYTQGLMDLGSSVCTRSKYQCQKCPLKEGCHAYTTNTQSILPTPKPKKIRPERHVVMLLWQVGDTLYLERRPDTGIWGGLWSLPEFSTKRACLDFLEIHTKHQCKNLSALAILTHQFTHFTLHIQPFILKMEQNQCPDGMRDNGMWHPMDAMDQIGMPKPVRDMVDGLFDI